MCVEGISGMMPIQEVNKACSHSGACVIKYSGICTNVGGPSQMLVNGPSGLKWRGYIVCNPTPGLLLLLL